MKHLFILMTMAVLFTACKKTKDESLQPVVAKNLVEMNLSNGIQWKFDYNSSGRLTNAINKYTNTFYQQQLPFLLKHTYLNSGDVYEFRNALKNADGRIISADRFYNGTLQSKLKFTYNADGYITNMLWERVDIVSKTELHYYYQGGNLVKLEDYGNDKLDGTYLYEYDLAKQNHIKIDWFEFSQLGFIHDDQFGKMSRNLVKKEIHLDKNGNLYKQTEFQFMIDAEGYPAAMDLINSNYTLKYTFKFQ